MLDTAARVGTMVTVMAKIQALPEDLRPKAMEEGRKLMMKGMEARVDSYFAAPPDQRQKLIDDQLKPWLIEVNASPSLTANTREDYDLKFKLLMDTLDIVDMEGRFAPQEPPHRPPRRERHHDEEQAEAQGQGAQPEHHRDGVGRGVGRDQPAVRARGGERHREPRVARQEGEQEPWDDGGAQTLHGATSGPEVRKANSSALPIGPPVRKRTRSPPTGRPKRSAVR